MTCNLSFIFDVFVMNDWSFLFPIILSAKVKSLAVDSAGGPVDKLAT